MFEGKHKRFQNIEEKRYDHFITIKRIENLMSFTDVDGTTTDTATTQ